MNYKSNIQQLMFDIRSRTIDGLSKGANILKTEIKRDAPVVTGALRDSFEVNETEITDLKVEVGSDLDYAPIVEYGSKDRKANPFARQAFAAAVQKITNAFLKALKVKK